MNKTVAAAVTPNPYHYNLAVMNVSFKYKYIYIAPPRTGTRTISTFLREYYDMQAIANGTVLKTTQEGIQVLHDYKIIPGYEDYLKIMSIRNPYARFVSIWKNYTRMKKIPPMVFPDSLMNKRTQLSYIRDTKIDYYIRLEYLKKDLEALPFVKHPVILENRYETVLGDKWQNHFVNDQRALNMVNKLLHKEIVTFGYRKILKAPKKRI